MTAIVGSTGTVERVQHTGETVEVRIDRIAAGGDGVGREASGRVIFVGRTAPGDRLKAALSESHSKWARGVPVSWTERSPLHRSAPCAVYAECGGCRLQHLPEEAQRTSKRDIVADASRRIGGLSIDVARPVESGGDLGYRNRVTFTLRRDSRTVVAGYRRYDDPGDVIDIEECPLAEVAVGRAWTALRSAWGGGASRLPAGAELRLTLRGSERGEVDLLVEGGEPWNREDAGDLLRSVPGLVGCHQKPGSRPWKRLAGARGLCDRWQGLEFELPPGVFLQVNRTVSARMDQWLDERVGDVAGRRILDLYAGVAARGIRWAARGASVTACEVQASACSAGRAAAELAGVEVELLRGRVEDLVAGLLPSDLVVINPPRAGLGRRVARSLVSGEASCMAYVSCDPATLARDLARLSAAWSVEDVQPFDAFPQTAHVETIAWLKRIPESRSSEGNA